MSFLLRSLKRAFAAIATIKRISGQANIIIGTEGVAKVKALFRKLRWKVKIPTFKLNL